MRTKTFLLSGKCMLVLLAAAIMALCMPQKLMAQSFSGSGSGTENDPYLIYNPIHLNEVHNFINQEGVVFKLMQDVDLTTWIADNTPTNGWLPIGTQAEPFKGVFLGNGKSISGLYIQRSTMDYVGLFGYTSGATISGLTLNNATVNARNYVGTIVGYATGTTFTDIVTVGNVNGVNTVGGFAGMIDENSSVNNVSHSGTVNASGGTAGGFIGKIRNCIVAGASHSGDITALGDDVGGLAGIIYASTIEESIVNAENVKGNNKVGGIVGSCRNSTINATYSTCEISGNENVGGFVGIIQSKWIVGSSVSSFTDTHHYGTISASGGNVGGYIGLVFQDGGFNLTGSSHFGNIVAQGDNVSCGIGSNASTAIFGSDDYDSIPLRIVDCYSVGDISGANNIGGLVGFNSATAFTTNRNTGYVNAQAYDIYTELGAANSTSGYYVYRCKGYKYYYDGSWHSNTSSLVYFYLYLTQDNGLSFTSHPGVVFHRESGRYNKPSESYRYTDYIDYGIAKSTTSIKTVISNSYYIGNINGNDHIGGLVGNGNIMDINTSYADGEIRGHNYVGGITGYLNTLYTDEDATSSITSCVSASPVIASLSDKVGRIYGAIGNNTEIGAIGSTSANKGLATAKATVAGIALELQDGLQHGQSAGSSTFKLKANYVGMGWEFDSYWKIQETECYPYKTNQCAPPKITVQPVSGATTVTGQSVDGGTITLLIGNETYTGTASGHNWTVTVPPLQSGALIKAYVSKEGFDRSYFTEATVKYPGSGTEDDPYQIYTASDLANVHTYDYYKVMSDIDVSEWIEQNSPDKGWVAIGSRGVSMRQLDGNGKTVSGIWGSATSDYYGMILSTENATVKDLTVNVADGKMMSGTSYTAVLVGKSWGSTFSNIQINGNVEGQVNVGSVVGHSSNDTFDLCIAQGSVSGADYVGGITGYAGGSVFNDCMFSGDVSGNTAVGGLLGYSDAAINRSCTYGTVTATGNVTSCGGGIAGQNLGSISDSFSHAEVTSGGYAAGIAGLNYGAVDKCYASGDIYAQKWGAGIAGYNVNAGAVVTHCFAANNRIVVSEDGGIGMRMIGGFRDGASEPDRSNYALSTMTVSVNNIPKIIYDDPLEGTAISLPALMTDTPYKGQGWDFNSTWGIDAGEGYPYLQALAGNEPEPDYIPGDANGDGVVNVTDYVATACYILEQNPQPFVFDAADLDENGTITVSDLVGVALIALNFEGTKLNAPQQALIGNEAEVLMTASCGKDADGNYVVTVNLDNNVDLTAMQMDVSLPAGVTLVDAQLTGRGTRSHQVEMANLHGGNYRVLTASSTCKPFKGSEGTLLTLVLSGEPQGEIALTGIQLAAPDASGTTHPDIYLDGATGVNELADATRIYRDGANIIIKAQAPGTAQLILPNGVSYTVKVNAGHNEFAAPATGIVIVRMGEKTAKLNF